MKIKLLFALITFGFFSLGVNAKIVITDGKSGTPLPKASIFDRNGIFIAVTDNEGIVPSSVISENYPLNVRYVGYTPVEISSPDAGTVAMEESIYELPEITVDEVSRNLLYIQAYLREYANAVDTQYTLSYFTEKIIDFVLPMSKKAKFKGWDKSRTLAQRNYSHIIKDR